MFYKVMEDKEKKIISSESYNTVFNKKTGFFARWGKTREEDPVFSPFGPEILDIEISENGCPNNCSFCSPAGTKVQTPSGKKNIEDIKVDDVVIGYDENNKFKEQSVKELYIREYNGDMIYIELENNRVLPLTPEHPVKVKPGVWKTAGELTEKDELIDYETKSTKNI